MDVIRTFADAVTLPVIMIVAASALVAVVALWRASSLSERLALWETAAAAMAEDPTLVADVLQTDTGWGLGARRRDGEPVSEARALALGTAALGVSSDRLRTGFIRGYRVAHRKSADELQKQ